MRYKSGARQKGLPVLVANASHATWTWEVPRKVQPGPARVTANCRGAGSATKRLTVIGQVLPPNVTVVKTGWSTRAYPYGGTGVSYGVILILVMIFAPNGFVGLVNRAYTALSRRLRGGGRRPVVVAV